MPGTHRIYLVPGFFGFANLGELRYFGHVWDFLGRACRAAGLDAEIHTVKTYPTASLRRRAARVLETIAATAHRGDGPIHLIGHSSGGLDVRLLAAPGVSLATALDVERFAARIRTVVTVSAPHYGTPVASFFTSLLGQRLLKVLSLSTIYVLRFGRVPLSVLLMLGAVFTRLDKRVGIGTALLDQAFSQLLADFSASRRRAIASFFGAVEKDQALLPQLTPESMDVFNAAVRDRPGVRYGSVLSQARTPGVGTTLAAGLDPSAQATHAIYVALHRLAAQTTPAQMPPLTREQVRAARHFYGKQPDAAANDGVVPTRSQAWGQIIHAARADHLDVVGHFADAAHVPPHVDWLTTGSGFNRPRFEALWTAVAGYLAGASSTRPRARRAPGTAPRAGDPGLPRWRRERRSAG
ncbi:MAG: esterase/lipase family protein [Candidatus Binatia bacterium]